jgi:TRAP-type C4-dicarboxylate transport system permease large subunit
VARTSAVVLFIIAAANLFGWILAAEDIPQKVATAILAISNNYWVVLLLFNLLLLVLGMFMETIAIIIIVLPIFLPILNQLGVDPVHLGVMVCVNLAIGPTHPLSAWISSRPARLRESATRTPSAFSRHFSRP